MTDKSTDTTDVGDFSFDYEDLPDELKNMVDKQLGGRENLESLVQITELTHHVFTAMLTCTLVSHNQITKHHEIHNAVVENVREYVSYATMDLAMLCREENVNKLLFNVMLKTRALVEDALDVKRYDGTPKGKECKLL